MWRKPTHSAKKASDADLGRGILSAAAPLLKLGRNEQTKNPHRAATSGDALPARKLQLARRHFAVEFPEPSIVYQQRGTSAGTAWLQSWEIRLNPVLLLENQQPFIDEVVPHELAHLLVFRQFGRVAPHGREWRWMMESVLLTPPAALTVSKPPRCKAKPSLPLRLRTAPAHHPPP